MSEAKRRELGKGVNGGEDGPGTTAFHGGVYVAIVSDDEEQEYPVSMIRANGALSRIVIDVAHTMSPTRCRPYDVAPVAAHAGACPGATCLFVALSSPLHYSIKRVEGKRACAAGLDLCAAPRA